MIQIFADKYTKRLEFVTRFIFCNVLKQEIKLMRNSSNYDVNKPSVYYGKGTCADESAFVICPAGLLDELGGNSKLIPDVCDFNERKALFAVEGGDICFDIFSAVFYLISRYEEYGKKKFSYSDSIAYKNGFINEPIVDFWIYDFETMLQKRIKTYTPQSISKMSFVVSVNIEQHYKYRHKNLFSTISVLARKLFRGEFSRLKKHLKVLFYLCDDPYDNIERIIQQHSSSSVVPIFFMSMKCTLLGRLANYKRMLYRSFLVGLIPSSINKSIISAERARLEKKIVHTHVRMSRYNFNNICIPQSYQLLDSMSFADDYSMGYVDCLGFRASTSHPYRMYDLQNEQILNVKVHHVALSDKAFVKMGISRSNVSKEYISIAKSVKMCGGELVSCFSNVSLSNNGRWAGWNSEYLKAIKEIAKIEIQ